MGIWYCTVEDVMSALDVKESAHLSAQIGDAIESGARSIDAQMCRRFWPQLGTRYFDWPNPQNAPAHRLWLDDNEIISLTALTAGGVTIDPANYYLEPANSGPPFNRLELRSDATATFSGGTTWQRAIGATGLFGNRDDQVSAGTIVGALSSSATTLTASDGVAIGTGTLLLADAERMIVTARGWVSSAQTLQTPLTASKANVSVAVTTGNAYAAGETLLLDSERMLIIDVAGNTLTVQRAVQGSILATHTGSTIYVRRALTVSRAAAGTTAAAHLDGAALYAWRAPALIRRLNIAEACWIRQGDASGWVGSAGAGETARVLSSGQLAALRKEALTAHGRKTRHRGV